MKIKGLKKAAADFNRWPATARIYVDFDTGHVWTETFVQAKEGRNYRLKRGVVEVHNKEGLYCENITITEDELLEKIELEREEQELNDIG